LGKLKPKIIPTITRVINNSIKENPGVLSTDGIQQGLNTQ
jgi:hypothetical protein